MRTSALRSSAHLVAEVVDGRTRCTTMRSSPPITLRTTPDAVYLVGSAAGPLGGDHTRLQVDVGRARGWRCAARRRRSCSPAPRVVFRGPRPICGSVPGVCCVGCSSRCSWRRVVTTTPPRGSASTRAQPSCSARSSSSDVIRSRRGRCARTSASTSTNAALLRSTLLLGPRWPHADGPAGVDHARAVAQTLVVGVEPSACGVGAPVEGVRSAVMALGPDAALVSEVTADPGRLTTNLRQQTVYRTRS